DRMEWSKAASDFGTGFSHNCNCALGLNDIASSLVIMLKSRRTLHMRIRDSHLNLQILIGALTFCCFSLMTCAAQDTNSPKTYPPPGKLVDVGGWRLHLNCTGKNTGKTPTVVLESGSGDFSVKWLRRFDAAPNCYLEE